MSLLFGIIALAAGASLYMYPASHSLTGSYVSQFLGIALGALGIGIIAGSLF